MMTTPLIPLTRQDTKIALELVPKWTKFFSSLRRPTRSDCACIFILREKQKVRRPNLVFVEFLTKGGAR